MRRKKSRPKSGTISASLHARLAEQRVSDMYEGVDWEKAIQELDSSQSGDEGHLAPSPAGGVAPKRYTMAS